MSLPRATCSDRDFAEYIHTQAEKLPINGIYELRTAAAGGHVTLGGRVDSPETLKQVVTAVAGTPGLCELSFYGVEFCPPDVSDAEIAAKMRIAAEEAIGPELAAGLGYYCENHFAIVHGRLPSLPMREKLDEAVRAVPGVAQYHISCEVVLENPPSDEAVVAAVRRKLRSPFDLANTTFRASQIDVRSQNNVVYLSGQTSKLLGKLSAGSQAAQVEGVRYVVNQIQVPGIPPEQRPQNQNSTDQPPGDAPPPDDSTNQPAVLVTPDDLPELPIVLLVEPVTD
jgi:osmotically-inducible protein OsmY